jgi:hypothetical protein
MHLLTLCWLLLVFGFSHHLSQLFNEIYTVYNLYRAESVEIPESGSSISGGHQGHAASSPAAGKVDSAPEAEEGVPEMEDRNKQESTTRAAETPKPVKMVHNGKAVRRAFPELLDRGAKLQFPFVNLIKSLSENSNWVTTLNNKVQLGITRLEDNHPHAQLANGKVTIGFLHDTNP